jgi:hypothetical protein
MFKSWRSGSRRLFLRSRRMRLIRGHQGRAKRSSGRRTGRAGGTGSLSRSVTYPGRVVVLARLESL